MEKRLYRSRTERLIWGVCGGLGKYFEVDPVLIRVFFVLLIFTGGIGILAYIIMAIVVPLEGSTAASPRETTRENIEEMKKTAEEFGEDMRSSLASHRAERAQEDGARIHRRRNLIGIAIVIIGVIALLSSLNIFWWFRWAYFWPVILIIIGLFIIVTAYRPR